MNNRSIRVILLLFVASIFLCACGTTPPKDFGGRWKPVNRFAEQTTAIPLYGSYVYQVSPADGTLKKMLERWAKDTGVTLDYRISNDYTLYAAVASMKSTDVAQAISMVESAYSEQGVKISWVNSVIEVSTK